MRMTITIEDDAASTSQVTDSHSKGGMDGGEPSAVLVQQMHGATTTQSSAPTDMSADEPAEWLIAAVGEATAPAGVTDAANGMASRVLDAGSAPSH